MKLSYVEEAAIKRAVKLLLTPEYDRDDERAAEVLKAMLTDSGTEPTCEQCHGKGTFMGHPCPGCYDPLRKWGVGPAAGTEPTREQIERLRPHRDEDGRYPGWGKEQTAAAAYEQAIVDVLALLPQATRIMR